LNFRVEGDLPKGSLPDRRLEPLGQHLGEGSRARRAAAQHDAIDLVEDAVALKQSKASGFPA
jgi:hypothetical protein